MSESQALLAVFDGDIPLFEQKGRPNGFTTWSARWLAKSLGYQDFTSFKTVLNKSQQVLLTLGIDVTEHFNAEETTDEKGHIIKDVRLSRFACYLAAMNGDVKKRAVAQAQVYFARFSEECQRFMDDPEPIDRVLIRKEVSKHERGLSHAAQRAGVESFAMFRNAGYRGLYNMNLADLKRLKGIPSDRTPLDFMGKDELAANLFCITQTEAKIRTDKIRGQQQLESTAEGVGEKVRSTMYEISGQRPEDLPKQKDIRVVHRELKSDSGTLKYGSTSDLTELPAAELYLEAPEEAED